jgi:hypothetical protein
MFTHLLFMHECNMISYKTVCLHVSQEKFVWVAYTPTTEVVFNFNLKQLPDTNPSAAEYLKQILAAKWGHFSHYRTNRLYGWRTTNIVESEQALSLKLKPRQLLQFENFKANANI